MNPELREFVEVLKAITDDAKATFGTLSSEQLNWKPNESEWSVGQCFDHLIKTNDLYFINIQKVADGTHRNNIYSKIPFVTPLIGMIMKKLLGPDSGKKIKTFKIFEPSSSYISENTLEDFNANQSRFVLLMQATKDLDVRQIKIAEPIRKAVNLRLVDAFDVLIVHEKRHIIQAKRVLETQGFPSDFG